MFDSIPNTLLPSYVKLLFISMKSDEKVTEISKLDRCKFHC